MIKESVRIGKYIEFPEFTDGRGSLCFGEFPKQMPFEAKRWFAIYRTPEGAIRGEHAHKHCQQIHICTHGSARFSLDDGLNKESVLLHRHNTGYLLPPMVWHSLTMGYNSSLLVLCSHVYDELDYIRNYDDFLKAVKAR